MLKTYAESATEFSIFVISTSIIHQEKNYKPYCKVNPGGCRIKVCKTSCDIFSALLHDKNGKAVGVDGIPI